MRIIYPSVARNAYYDRTPVVASKRYEQINIAPHATTQRWLYTVPANKNAILQAVHLLSLRSAAAVAAAFVELQISIQIGGIYTRIAHVTFVDNTINKQYSFDMGYALNLVTGTLIQGVTTDLSNGGTVDYYINAFILEYDA